MGYILRRYETLHHLNELHYVQRFLEIITRAKPEGSDHLVLRALFCKHDDRHFRELVFNVLK